MKFEIKAKCYSYNYIVNLLCAGLFHHYLQFSSVRFLYPISGWEIAYLVQRIVDQGGSSQPPKFVLIITLSVIGVIVCRLILGVIRNAVQHKLSLKIQPDEKNAQLRQMKKCGPT